MTSWPQPPSLHDDSGYADCPNCGGSGTSIGFAWRDRKTGQTFYNADVLETRASSVIVLGFAVGLGLLANWLLGPGAVWWGAGAGVILALVLITVLVYRNVQRSALAYKVTKYKCQRCLHKWEQSEGKPVPRYNERQEILADYRASFHTDDSNNNITK